MNDEQAITKLFEDGDRALMSADEEELRRIYADDYEQYNESGERTTRQDLIQTLTSGRVRFLSMKSTGRKVRLFAGFAIVHGSEEDEFEQEGRRLTVRYIYMDLVVKRAGRWQIAASQLAKPSIT